MSEASRPYEAGGPGRFDTDGNEWWACDPYPTWYRRVGGRLVTETRTIRWADEREGVANDRA